MREMHSYYVNVHIVAVTFMSHNCDQVHSGGRGKHAP